MRKCPFCAEEIQDEAKKCRHCGEFLDTATPSLNKPGDVLDHFCLEKELGRGGMGTVYLAEDRHLSRKVALKILPATLLHDPALPKRFKKEAQIAAGLIHPNIISIFAVGETGSGQPYYAMTFLSGGSLADRLKTGPMAFSEALRLTQEILAGLGFAHSKGVIHRDIKPGNILLTETGSAVIVDFGIAHASIGTSVKTISGSMIGTPHYMSPEQWNGQTVDGRSDLYALGIMLYQMLTGDPPFIGGDANAVMCGHLLQPVPAPSTRVPAIPPALDAILLKALKKEPQERFQSAEEFHTAIEQEMGISGRTPLPKPDLQQTTPLNTTLPTPVTAAPLSTPPASPISPAAPPAEDSPVQTAGRFVRVAIRYIVGYVVIPIVVLIILILLLPDETVNPDLTAIQPVTASSTSRISGNSIIASSATFSASPTLLLTTSVPVISSFPGTIIRPVTDPGSTTTTGGWASNPLSQGVATEPAPLGKGLLAAVMTKYPRGRLFFLSDTSGVFQVYAATLDGKSVSQVTDAPEGVKEFRVSGSARQVAYLASGTGREIYLIGLDGLAAQKIVEPDLLSDKREITSLAWFPDGTRLAFSVFSMSGKTYQTKFYTRAMSATSSEFLASVPNAECRVTDISPSQTDLLFLKREDRTNEMDWLISHLDIRTKAQSFYQEYALGARFSPDGREMVFARFAETGDPEMNIVRMDLEGENSRAYTRAKPGKSCLEPTWIPDGSGFFYAYDTGEVHQVWSFDSAGRGFQRVTSHSYNERAPEFVPE